ncbi:MAG: IclR family transcriptional regulator C-terminal domain-containing protein [Puniceicoccaceae bacterium]
MNFKDPSMRTALVENSIDLLAKLRDSTGITSAMAIMADNMHEGIVLASLPGKMDHCYVPRVGFHFHLHCTAPGKALLSHLPESELAKILPHLPYDTFTSATCHDPNSLGQAVSESAKHGYAIDISEYVTGVNCVASCIPWEGKRPLAAIWITALEMDLPKEELPKFGAKVKAIAREMSVRLKSVAGTQSIHLDSMVKSTKEFIDLHFLNPDAIEEYIEDLPISSGWLRKSFRKKYGISPVKYRQKLIMERAQRLLKNTFLSVKEIAFQLHFDNQNYFSRVFKTQVGVSPQIYREKAKDKG